MKRYDRPNSACRSIEQVDHLRLHRDVERRDRLVADDQLRPQRERARDAEALALAAGELVRVLDHLVRRAGPPCRTAPRRARGPSAAASRLVVAERLGDDVGRAHARIERRVRVLEDHLQLAPERAHRRAAERDRCAARATRSSPAVGSSSRRMVLPAVDLPQPRLADEAERLALGDREADAVDGVHLAGSRARTRPCAPGSACAGRAPASSGAVMSRPPPGDRLPSRPRSGPAPCPRAAGTPPRQRAVACAQRGANSAAGDRLLQRGHHARDLGEPLALAALGRLREPRDRAEQPVRVRMARPREERRRPAPPRPCARRTSPRRAAPSRRRRRGRA